MPTYFLQVWHMSMNAYTRKEQKYRADGVHVDYGYNAIHGQNYHLKGDLVLPANEEMRPGGVAMYVLLSILVLPVVVDTLYIHFSRGMRDFRQAMYATGAPSFEYTVGTFIMNILGLPMWALTSLVPQIVGNILYPNPWSALVHGKMTRWHSIEGLMCSRCVIGPPAPRYDNRGVGGWVEPYYDITAGCEMEFHWYEEPTASTVKEFATEVPIEIGPFEAACLFRRRRPLLNPTLGLNPTQDPSNAV